MKSKDYTAALKSMQLLTKCSPKSRRLRKSHTKLLIELGQFDEAHSQLIQMQSSFPQTDIYYLKGIMCYSQGNS